MEDQPGVKRLARILIDSYLRTSTRNHELQLEAGTPVNIGLSTQLFRFNVQAQIICAEDLELLERYKDFGYVEVFDRDRTFHFALRSATRIQMEMQQGVQLSLTGDEFEPCDTQLLVAKFRLGFMDLGIAPAFRRPATGKLVASGHPVDVGSWSLDEGSSETFEEATDPFNDVGDIELDEDAGSQA
jgi:hypothetical protein